MADDDAEQTPEASGPLKVHSHPNDSGQSISPEQAAFYSIAFFGLLCNLLLIVMVVAQRHTRRLTSAFILHSAFLNLLLSFLTFAFASGLSSSFCRAMVSGCSTFCSNMTTAYIVFQTVWVFNLIPTVCCEIFHLDSGKGRSGGSVGCAAFGIVLVYVCSAIIHLGPTLIGSNYDSKHKTDRCLFLHGHPKNYTMHLTWTVIVTVAIACNAFLLVHFRRQIDSSIRGRIRAALPGRTTSAAALEFVSADAPLAATFGLLADLKINRQRVQCAVCGLFVVCWYPLYFLALTDPLNKAPEPVYHLFTAFGFAKTILEPITVAFFDRTVGRRTTMRLLPCTRRLRYVSEAEVDHLLGAAATAGCPDRSDSTSAIASGSSTVAVATGAHERLKSVAVLRPQFFRGDTPLTSDVFDDSV